MKKKSQHSQEQACTDPECPSYRFFCDFREFSKSIYNNITAVTGRLNQEAGHMLLHLNHTQGLLRNSKVTQFITSR